METVEVVIKIPKVAYDIISQQADDSYDAVTTFPETIGSAIANGTALQKGHGRLGDLDALYTDISNGIKAGNYEEGYEQYGHINNLDDVLETIKFADPVIEADKEVE